MNSVLGDRTSFEDRLRKMSGIEYVVKYDPIESQIFLEGIDGPEASNVWVIHKQERRKRPHAEDEVTLLAVFYIVGDSIFMAPFVQRVVNNRMVHLSKNIIRSVLISAAFCRCFLAQGAFRHVKTLNIHPSAWSRLRNVNP